MKLAVAIAQETASPSAFVVWRGFESSMRKAAEFGYDGVELALRRRDDVDRPALSRMLREFGLGVSAISTGQVFADLGLSLTNPDPDIRSRAIEVLSDLTDLASEFGQMVNLGRVRGSVMPGQTMAEAEALFLEGYQTIIDHASRQGVCVILEPVNRYEINFINNLDQGSTLLRKLPMSPFIGLMPDVFHMNIEDDHIGDSLRRNRAFVKYIHLAIGDSLRRNRAFVKYIHLADSNRWAPGWGHMNFDEVFQALADIAYKGWASVEILPFPTPDEAARQAIAGLRPYLNRI